eukprot:gene9941-12191_t
MITNITRGNSMATFNNRTMSTTNLIPVDSSLIPALTFSILNLRSSSDIDSDHGVKNSLLNFEHKNDGYWQPKVSDTKQYIMASSPIPLSFMAISLQGAGEKEDWVTSFKIRYTLDCKKWFDYNNNNGVEVFPANKNSKSIVTLKFDVPLIARCITLAPQTWNNNIALRWEIYTQQFKEPPQVQVGTVSIGDRSLNGSTDEGVRTETRMVLFEKPFSVVPKVSIGIRLLDSTQKDGQTRILVETANITTLGFDCLFKTWNGCSIYEAFVDYVAVANHPDVVDQESDFKELKFNIDLDNVSKKGDTSLNLNVLN